MGHSRTDPPGPRYYTPFTLWRTARPDPLRFCADLARQYGDVVCFRVALWRSYLVFHPDLCRHVLQENHQNYRKGFLVERTKVLIGNGLFSSEGDLWRRQRRLAQPAFHRQQVETFVRLICARTAEALDAWMPHAREGAPLDIAAEMSRLTLRIVGDALFGVDLGDDAARFGHALLEALDFVNRRVMSAAPVPLWLPTPRTVRFRSALRALDDVVYRIIQTRRRDNATGLLSMLILAHDDTDDDTMSDHQLRDEVMTLLLAGHETTAALLAWTCYLLGMHPEVEERLRAEVRRTLDGRPPTVSDLPHLPYLRMIIEESLRLYPPLPFFSRQAAAADSLGGYDITSGSVVSLCPFVTHRHPAFWEDPERFDPERFAPPRATGRSRYAYFPFGGGPRQCIGFEFALLEASLILLMVVQRYRLRLVSDGPVEPEFRLTLRPRGGLRFTVHGS